MKRAAPLFLAVLALSCQKEEKEAEKGEEETAPSALPGAEPPPKELREKLADRREELGSDYEPRTRHREPDGAAKYTNRLFLEASPYLMQHAHNPVDWFPWGEEALERAQELGRPIFLSIGYSTCHWCHVMEEESFEDPEIARYLNENYVAIKVDREERPDIDSVYMSAVQRMTGQGGWPLNVWLTPEGKPFFGATYFPPEQFKKVLQRAKDQFDQKRERVVEQADMVARMIDQASRPEPGEARPDAEVLRAAARFYRERFDGTFGGLRTGRKGNKFPSSLPIRFLLRYWRRTGEDEFRDMAELTLEKMAAGGMYDQIGGGFHRYSTDRRWLVPHFEKMLYDNARLAVAYLEGYQATGREDLARVAREVLAYVAREMTSPEGAFYSATDADSPTPEGEREEGYFFTWTPEEVREVVSEPKQAELVLRYYDITERGNFAELEGRSIPNRPRALGEVAREVGMPEAKARAALDRARAALYRARSERPPPLRDEKILTAWNGLMISAYARAARVLGRDEERGLDYAERASRAADFLLEELRVDGRLRRSYKDGRARLNAYLDDYAFLIAALLDLYEATAEPRWLAQAVELDRVLGEHYEDEEGGGFYLTSDDHEQLLIREKPAVDKAVPSGNSVAALNLVRLHELTSDPAYRERADRLLSAFAGTLERRPSSLDVMLLTLDFRSDTAREIVLVTPESVGEAAPFREVLGETFLPNHVLVVTAEGEGLSALAERVPLVERKKALGGRPTAYVCERGRCELPTPDPEVFGEQISKVEPLQGRED